MTCARETLHLIGKVQIAVLRLAYMESVGLIEITFGLTSNAHSPEWIFTVPISSCARGSMIIMLERSEKK